jgi:hypothetical protein
MIKLFLKSIRVFKSISSKDSGTFSNSATILSFQLDLTLASIIAALISDLASSLCPIILVTFK